MWKQEVATGIALIFDYLPNQHLDLGVNTDLPGVSWALRLTDARDCSFRPRTFQEG